MIPRDTFINKLRALGYTYSDQTDKSQLWRKKGGTHCVWIRRKEDPLSEAYVRSTLTQCGCALGEIERFVAEYRKQRPPFLPLGLLVLRWRSALPNATAGRAAP